MRTESERRKWVESEQEASGKQAECTENRKEREEARNREKKASSCEEKAN
jgi:hypothetical protein